MQHSSYTADTYGISDEHISEQFVFPSFLLQSKSLSHSCSSKQLREQKLLLSWEKVEEVVSEVRKEGERERSNSQGVPTREGGEIRFNSHLKVQLLSSHVLKLENWNMRNSFELHTYANVAMQFSNQITVTEIHILRVCVCIKMNILVKIMYKTALQ